jgi:hypothetical protein
VTQLIEAERPKAIDLALDRPRVHASHAYAAERAEIVGFFGLGAWRSVTR